MNRPFPRRTALGLIVLTAASGVAHAQDAKTPLAALRPGGLPDGWTAARTGRGFAAEWAVVPDPTARDGLALTQTRADPTDYRYPLAIAPGALVADVEVTVRFKPVSGRADQAAGLAVRLRDADNYYVVRANALEDNANLYRVVRGRREQIKGASVKVSPGEWHTIGLRVQGPRLSVSFDGKPLFTAEDRTFLGPGKIAL